MPSSEDYRVVYERVLESFGARISPLEKLQGAVLIDILARLEQLSPAISASVVSPPPKVVRKAKSGNGRRK